MKEKKENFSQFFVKPFKRVKFSNFQIKIFIIRFFFNLGSAASTQSCNINNLFLILLG